MSGFKWACHELISVMQRLIICRTYGKYIGTYGKYIGDESGWVRAKSSGVNTVLLRSRRAARAVHVPHQS